MKTNMTSLRNLLFHLTCPSQSSSRFPDVWTDFGRCLTCTMSVLIDPVQTWVQQWGEEAGGSRASCGVTCSAVNPMRKYTPAFQLVHPPMSCYSVSLCDISGTKSNMLKLTISYHLLLWIYIIPSSNYWLTQSVAMGKVSFEVTRAKI